MPAALEGVAADVSIPAARRSAAVPVFLAASGAVLAFAVLAGGATSEGRLAWIGGAAIAVAVAGALVLPRPAPGRAGVGLAGALVAWVAWTGVTVGWSIEADRSWEVLNRGLAYLALFALGVLAGAVVSRAASLTAAALVVLFGAATAWALAGKVVPALGPDVERSARLEAPVGYWNALALLVAMSLPLWCWLGTVRGRPRRLDSAVAAGAVAASVVALALTASRGGIVVAAVAVAAWLLLSPTWRESLLLLVVGGVPGAAVAAWALTRPALTDGGELSRGGDGAVLGILLVAALGVAAVAAVLLPAPGIRVAAALAAGAVVLGVAGVIAVTVAVGGPGELVDRFCTAGDATNEPGRLATVSSNNRCTWWGEAAEIWRENPVGGTGAGTFATARKPIRDGPASPIEPHDLPLRALSETGIVGLALVLAAIGAAVAVAVGALRRLEGGERLAAAALVAGGAAFLAHSLVDMGLEFVAVTAPVLVSLGVLASAGRGLARARATTVFGVAAAVVLALAAIASLASPRLADARAEDSLDALLAGDAREAVSLAEEAQLLNPLAVRPLHVEAAAQQALGRLDEAERLYVEAVRLQPENPETWYRLGVFELDVRGDARAALLALDRSWGLDPFGGAQHRLEEARRRAARQR